MPWKKGESGNPKGRPRKKRALSNMLRTLGASKAPGDDITRRRRLAQVVWEMALEGDLAAAKLIYEYCDGKPTQRLEHSGTGGGPLQVQYVNDWRGASPDAPHGAASDTEQPVPVQVAGGGPEVAQDDSCDASGD